MKGVLKIKLYDICEYVVLLEQYVTYIYRHIHGADALFHEYSCPVFYGLVITVSGFDSTERGEIKTMIEAEGNIILLLLYMN